MDFTGGQDCEYTFVVVHLTLGILTEEVGATRSLRPDPWAKEKR